MIGEIFAALFVGHQLGDHWVQSDGQATKKEHSARACVSHVITYELTILATLAALVLVTGATFHPLQWWTGLIVSAVSHYWADRRTPLRRLAGKLGKAGYWERGGAYQLDQSWHYLFLFIRALIMGA